MIELSGVFGLIGVSCGVEIVSTRGESTVATKFHNELGIVFPMYYSHQCVAIEIKCSCYLIMKTLGVVFVFGVIPLSIPRFIFNFPFQ